MFLVLVFLGFVSLTGSAQASDSIFTLTIDDFPAADAADCQAQATNFGVALAQMGNVQRYSEQCQPEAFAGTYHIALSYLAHDRVADLIADDQDYATYEDQDTCEGDREAQAQ